MGLTATERRAEAALAAQSRLEAWSALSTRINEWMLIRMIEPSGAQDSTAVTEALQRLEMLTAQDVRSAPDEAEAGRRAAEIRHVANMRSFFNQLKGLQPDTQAGQAGIAFHMTHAPRIIAGRMEQETRRRDQELQGLEALRQPLRLGMAAFVVAAPLLLWLIWRGALRPIFRGLRQASAAAGRLSFDTPPNAPTRHDELGLMFARMRQASARIARRRARLQRDLADLEGLVAARTAELSAANTRLSAIDASRRRFFADVSHELRTPLTVILGEAELGAATPNPDLRQSFRTITARAERLFRRIEDLLRIARSESGELELVSRDLALDQVVRAAREDVLQLLERSRMTLHIELPEGLQVQADPDWLRQILAGFFENSVKFAGEGSVIRITAQRRGERVRIQVTDNGSGPQPPMDAAVFARLSRNAPATVSGFGMGLALAHWAAQAFGGDLRRLPMAEGFGLELELFAAEESGHGPYSDRRR